MDARNALAEVNGALNDWSSFLESVDPEFRQDDEGEDRLEKYQDGKALEVLGDALVTIGGVENALYKLAADIRALERGDTSEDPEAADRILRLARILGQV